VTGYIVTISSADNVKATVGNEWMEGRRRSVKKRETASIATNMETTKHNTGR